MAETLLDVHQLLKKYPALKHWGLRWLIRNRRIPLIRIGRRIFFDPADISAWLDAHKIPPLKEGNND